MQHPEKRIESSEDDSDEDYTLCPFFKSLVVKNNIAKRDEDLQTFQTFITKNKPSYKLLEDELLLMINTNAKLMFTEGNNPLKVIVSRLLELYEVARKKGHNPLIAKLFLKSLGRFKFEYLQYYDEDVKNVALDSWKKVDGMNLTQYLKVFEIGDRINREELLPTINSLIVQEKVNEAVCYIVALELQQHFNIPDLISKLVHQNKFDIAAKLVENLPIYQRTLIDEMTNNKLASRGADYVKKFKLNPDEFPELVERLQKNCLRYYVALDNWMKVEEKFFGLKNILGFYVEDLVFKQEYDVALSIAQRHDLMNSKAITKPDTLEELSPYWTNPPTKTFTYIENKLFSVDGFVPTEEILGDAPEGTYWNFKDFGVDIEKDMLYVDSCESELFDKVTQKILNSKVVGIDSEFRMSMTKFDKSGTALLQVANEEKEIFLIDSLKLSTYPKYNEFLHQLFTDPKILKVGHTLSADLEIVKRDSAENRELVIRNHLDIPRAFRGLHPELKQSSLAYICEKMTGKPMSKYEQISNWNQRPLRKTQIHYAAMDAYILIEIYEKMKVELEKIGDDIERFIDSSVGGVIVGSKKAQDDIEEEDFEKDEIGEKRPEDEFFDKFEEQKIDTQEEEKLEARKKPYRPKAKKDEKSEKPENPVKKERKPKIQKEIIQFHADPKYADYYSNPEEIKFVVDNMAHKLAKYMRNIGLDAEFLSVKDHNELTELAKLEKRVIITRDTKYFSRQLGVPTFFLKSTKTPEQLKEIIDYFKLNVNSGNFQSRCVKCNHAELIVLDLEEAKKNLQWKREEDYQHFDEYWQCAKCKQIYWEGKKFQNAQERFKEFTGGDEEWSDDDEEDTGFKFEDSKNPTEETGLQTDLQNFDFD